MYRAAHAEQRENERWGGDTWRKSEKEKRGGGEGGERREGGKQGRRASAGDPDVVKVAGPVQRSGDQKGRGGGHRAGGRKINKREV